MFKRTRDRIMNLKPQERVEYSEWSEILDKFNQAKEFLSDSNKLGVMLRQSLQEAENMVLENRVREVHEEHTVTETFKKIFVTPKKLQDDEVIGQIKFIRSFFAELNSWIDLKEELEKREANGKTIIDRNPENRDAK